MISKIGYTPRVQTRPQPSRQVSFTSRYNSTFSDMNFNKEIVNSHISSMSGDIDATNSILNQGASTMSGDIDISNCKVTDDLDAMSGNISVYQSKIKGNVKSISGDVHISDKSSVSGNVSTTSGDVRIEKSNVKGKISTTTGKIMLRDADITGNIITKPEKLILKGKNSIRDLILNAQNQETITMNTGNCVIHIGHIDQIITDDGVVINYPMTKIAKNTMPAKPIKFTLPAGNTITNSVEFKSKVPGLLFLEKGAKLLGEVINGTVKYLK